jgi:hypothetical protein
VLVLAGAAVAIASRSSAESPPPPKPLGTALHDALAAPAPAGVSGRIEFSNRLVDGAAVPGGTASPLLAGAKGRFWIAADGRTRLELQSSDGDAQILIAGRRLTIYDPRANVVYATSLPQGDRHRSAKEPGVGQVQQAVDQLARSAILTGATPGTVAGRAAYTVRIAPRHDGGLLGAAEFAWDAHHGVPLRAAVYAQGRTEPVLELKATEVRFGRVADGDVAPPRPPKARVIDVGSAPVGRSGGAMGATAALRKVQSGVAFRISAPPALAGLPRRSIRSLSTDGKAGAVLTYGEGLGGLVVLQIPATGHAGTESDALPLQELAIGGATGHELATALGTVVTFERAGVAYTVLGSVPPAAAEAAARAL